MQYLSVLYRKSKHRVTRYTRCSFSFCNLFVPLVLPIDRVSIPWAMTKMCENKYEDFKVGVRRGILRAKLNAPRDWSRLQSITLIDTRGGGVAEGEREKIAENTTVKIQMSGKLMLKKFPGGMKELYKVHRWEFFFKLIFRLPQASDQTGNGKVFPVWAGISYNSPWYVASERRENFGHLKPVYIIDNSSGEFTLNRI